MGCGCGKTGTWTPPTPAELAAAREAKVAARATLGVKGRTARTQTGQSGRQAPGYAWNGPQPSAQ